MAENKIITRVLASVQQLDAQTWNVLLASQSTPTPFMRHEYLAAMEQSGSATPVRPVTTAEFVRPAKRPRHSVLRNYMLEQTIGDPFRPWQEGLAEYLRLEALR